MKRLLFGSVLCAAVALAGCNVSPSGSPPPRHGRYAGIGVYPVGELWPQIAGPNASNDPAAALPADDEHVIVVVDGETGEIRECGDYSGRCIRMNPWTRAIGAVPATPVRLVKHAAELAAERVQVDAVRPEKQ